MACLGVILRVSCQVGPVKVKEGFRLPVPPVRGRCLVIASETKFSTKDLSGTGLSRGTLGRRPVLPDGFFFARRSCKAVASKYEGTDGRAIAGAADER